MAKIIRPAYPLEFSIGLLLVIFSISGFLSFEVFSSPWHEVMEGGSTIFGMALVGAAVVIMSLILWEEFLFPIRIKPSKDEITFRNHFVKLSTQLIIYLLIPVIVGVVYFNFQVRPLPFFLWAGICTVAPLGKLFSGVKNFNDFLKITNHTIEYRNNKKEGVLEIKKVMEIALIRDEEKVLHKIEVLMSDNRRELIDLDEMELEAYYHAIDDFITSHHSHLLKKQEIV